MTIMTVAIFMISCEQDQLKDTVDLLPATEDSVTARHADCFPKPFGCTDITTYNATVEVPGYPGCEIGVTYDLRFCQGVAQIGNLSITSISFSECADLISDFLDVIFNGTELQQERFFTVLYADIETSIVNSIFQEVYDSAVANNTLPLLYCNGGVTTFTASFYKGSCVSFCTGMGKDGTFTVTQVSCGELCCVKNISYCINQKTGEVETEVSTEPLTSGQCSPFPSGQCPKGTINQSPCFELCETE